MKCTFLVLLILKILISRDIRVDASASYFYPCNGSNIITVLYEKPVGNGNQYSVFVKTHLRAKSFIRVKFNSGATVKLRNSLGTVLRLPTWKENRIFDFQTISTVNLFSFTVNGPGGSTTPYLNSVIINFREYCENPLMGYLDEYVHDNRESKTVRVKREGKKKKKKKKKKEEEENIDVNCGRRKHLDYTALIVNGATSKPGDWPWHAAIYRRNKDKESYICGGTLIKKNFILTAAHCVSLNKVPVTPDVLSVVLGKYNFIEGDTSSQERNIFAVTVHEEFGCPKNLDNDIALLKLSTDVVYNEYVQPACIWYKKAKHKLPTDEIFGTVAGWGFDSMRALAPQLRQMTMPKIKQKDCIKKNPLFYGVMLKNERKFCAGWGNGTSPCNGDSGGGFMVFVPDHTKDESSTAGAWYIRGIVSLAVSFKDEAVCDPDQYVVFTNILKYKDWIKNNTME